MTKATAIYSSTSLGYLPLWIAADAGIFEKNGLDIDLQMLGATTNAVAATVSGQAQFGQVGGTGILAPAAGGADLKLVTMIVPVYEHVLEVASGIETGDDLRGKSLGVAGLGGESEMAVRAALQHLGLIESDVTIAAMGAPTTRVAAIKSGAIQGTVTTPPETLELEALGLHPLVDLAALHQPFPGQCTVVAGSYIASHRDVVQKYVDSLIEAIARCKQDKPFAVATMQKHIGYDDPHEQDVGYAFYTQEVFPSLPMPNADTFADALPEMAQSNPDLVSFDVRSILDPSFVQDAARRGLGSS